MPYQEHPNCKNSELIHTSYAFFTNQKGKSEGAFVIAGQPTRNVNLYSVGRTDEFGEKPGTVHSNIVECIKEINGPTLKGDHVFYMTTNYAKGGVPIIHTINEAKLPDIKVSARTSYPKDLNADLVALLQGDDVDVVLADALVLKKIPEQRISLCGASGDAHPIILIDDKNQVCAYMTGAHAAIKAGVFEQTISAMLEEGAVRENIKILIGPGLGPNSYEFAPDAPKIFNMTADNGLTEAVITKIFEPVISDTEEKKCLIHFAELIRYKAQQQGFTEAAIYDMELDTMAFNLYDDQRQRISSVDYAQLHKDGPLFFGARRTMLERHGAENSGLHNTVGRHLALVRL